MSYDYLSRFLERLTKDQFFGGLVHGTTPFSKQPFPSAGRTRRWPHNVVEAVEEATSQADIKGGAPCTALALMPHEAGSRHH